MWTLGGREGERRDKSGGVDLEGTLPAMLQEHAQPAEDSISDRVESQVIVTPTHSS